MDWQSAQMMQNVVFVQARIVSASIELEAMKADNKLRENQGMTIAYGEEDFKALIDKHAIGHNDIISALNSGF